MTTYQHDETRPERGIDGLRLAFGFLVYSILSTGCSPSTWLAKRMLDAPNRVPDFVKPRGRVSLSWPEGALERFPHGTNLVGTPAVPIHWVRVEPAVFGSRIESLPALRPRGLPAGVRMELRLPEQGLPPALPARGTVFVLHGYGVDLETMFPWAIFLAEAGWRAVLVDLPGHGRSGGRQVTFGVRETEMLVELREQLFRENAWNGSVFVLGHSMGAALALRWQARDGAMASAVALGAYSEFVPAALRLRDDYARWMPRGWVRRAAEKVSHLMNVPGTELDTKSVVANRRMRALLIASAADVVTPPEDSAILREALGADSRFIIVGNASHETLPFEFGQHGDAVKRWLDENASEFDLAPEPEPELESRQ